MQTRLLYPSNSRHFQLPSRGKTLKAQWAALDAAAKQPFEAKAAADTQRYEAELAAAGTMQVDA